MHIKPAVGQPRPVGEAIVAHLFEKDEDSRIPVVGVTGSRGKTPVAAPHRPPVCACPASHRPACSEGVFLDGRQVGNPRGHQLGRRRACADEPLRRGRGVREQLPRHPADGTVYDRCQRRRGHQHRPELHFGEFYIDAPRRSGTSSAPRSTWCSPRCAVLNAEDPAVVEMAPLSDGE